MRERLIFSWSGGKDSALALQRLRDGEHYEVVALLATCSAPSERVAMHGVRVELLEAQARALGLPLEIMRVSARSPNDEYRAQLAASLGRHRTAAVAFGDIFLADLRQWREQQLASLGLRGVFPLWNEDSQLLMRTFLAAGFEAVVCCVDDAWLDERAVGCALDAAFIESLPPQADVCGENGEYHSFVHAGPIFSERVPHRIGEKYYRALEATHPGARLQPPSAAGRRPTRGFWFCDLLSP